MKVMKVDILWGKLYARINAYINETRSIPGLISTAHARTHTHMLTDAML